MRELERNIPNYPSWEGSFYERLTEYCEWKSDLFWVLHCDLLNAALLAKDEPIDRNLVHMLLYLQERVLTLIAAHFNKNGVFEISNLTDKQLHEYTERFNMAILGVITAEVLPEASFNLVNPLVKNA